jgi:hypothetical protein
MITGYNCVEYYCRVRWLEGDLSKCPPEPYSSGEGAKNETVRRFNEKIEAQRKAISGLLAGVKT